MTDAVIEEFLDYYKHTHYKALAKRVKDLLSNYLPTDIQKILTFRCKERDSLRDKLKNMNEHRKRQNQPPFKDRKEIEENVFDLAGVRIALYVPQEKERVIKTITTYFPGAKWIWKRGKKDAPTYETSGKISKDEERGSSSPETRTLPDAYEVYNPVFAGYVADHARVKLSASQAEGLGDWKESHIVEIQVVSVLLHAWAEVEHDVVYKKVRREATVKERRILDLLNGSVMMAELLLGQLHMLQVEQRNESSKGRCGAFQDKFTLATFLDPYIRGLLSDEEKNNLEPKMLFGLLKAVQWNNPKELDAVLNELGFKKDHGLKDLDIVGRKYSELAKTPRPFLLARHMRLPFYIMEGVLSRLGVEEECNVQKRVMGSVNPDTDDYRSYQCRVLLSSFLWIGQLSLGGTSAGVMGTVQPANKTEENAFAWPFNSPARFAILVDGEKARNADVSEMDVLWDWFGRQKKDSFFSFAFRISKLGVVGSFPDDLAFLRKGYGDGG